MLESAKWSGGVEDVVTIHPNGAGTDIVGHMKRLGDVLGPDSGGQAIHIRVRALDEFVVDGIDTTLPLFRALVRDKDIIDGDYHIHWLEHYLARGDLAQ